MDIGKSFTFVFDDEDWIKQFLIGCLIAAVPIVNFACLGYVAQLIRNVRDGYEHPLPQWENFGEYFVDGLKLVVGMFVYFIPAFLLLCVFSVVMIGLEEMGGGEDLVFILAMCANCGMILLFIFPALLFPALFAQFAQTGEISSMFKFSEITSLISQNLTNYFIVLAITFVALNIIAPFGLILCFFGIFITQWWAYLVFGNLTGQLIQENIA